MLCCAHAEHQINRFFTFSIHLTDYLLHSSHEHLLGGLLRAGRRAELFSTSPLSENAHKGLWLSLGGVALVEGLIFFRCIITITTTEH